MKKKWIWMILAAGLLLASCRQNENPPVGTDTTPVPTREELPTKEPDKPANGEPDLGPTVVPVITEIPDVPAVPTPTQTPEPTLPPEPTKTSEPTKVPETTVTPAENPEQQETPIPSLSPVPDSEGLVSNGWQRAVSIEKGYEILFPELFRGSSLEKTDRELTVFYTDPSDEAVSFKISYHMQTSLEEYVAGMSLPEDILLYDEAETNRVSGTWQEEELMYRVVLIECRYAKAMLGNAFEGEEWIPGVMEIVLSYPAKLQEKYETAEYDFYVMKFGRE